MLKQDVLVATDCRGSIVNVVDYGPIPTLADSPIVAAIANAIVGLSKTDACDFAQDKIRVNCVASAEVTVAKAKPELPGGVPLPRKGTPEDVANAAVWLRKSKLLAERAIDSTTVELTMPDWLARSERLS